MRSVVTATAKSGKTQTKLIPSEVRRTKTLDFKSDDRAERKTSSSFEKKTS